MFLQTGKNATWGVQIFRLQVVRKCVKILIIRTSQHFFLSQSPKNRYFCQLMDDLSGENGGSYFR